MLQRNLFIITLCLLIISCATRKDLVMEKPCSTNYPIILVHGIGLRDDLRMIKYWSKIPKVLEKNGAKVFLSNQDAFNTHVANATMLRDRVYEVLNQTHAKKVNLIAHSKGGLESRYMISRLGMADKVASLTTLASPHRGSFMADTIMSWLNKHHLLNFVIKLITKYANLSGDKNPDVLNAAKNLTPDYMQEFNQSTPDMPGVYYQSYGGLVTNKYPALKVRYQHKIMLEAEGENDGIVSKKSYEWGHFRGVVKSDQDFGISHFDIIGMKFVSKQSTFDAESFIVDIAKDLKDRGL